MSCLSSFIINSLTAWVICHATRETWLIVMENPS